jgi:heme/copper-type cytochrome/quinol oxidase subunit 4
MERLTYLFTNPYTWLLIVFISVLPYALKYIRRFYPEELQKQMEYEEACTLKLNQKHEMKQMRKVVTIGFILSVVVSYAVAYHLIESSNNTFKIFSNIFMVLMSTIAIYAMITEHKINKDKNCHHISVKYYIVMFAVIIIIALLVMYIFKRV